MIIATLDTNVFVSGLLFSGPPRKALQAAIEGKYQLALSSQIFTELTEVLTRPKFGLSADYVHVAIRELEEISILVQPEYRHNVTIRAPKDKFIIDCAIGAGAAYIVTGDQDLLILRQVEGISIVSPKSFLELADLR